MKIDGEKVELIHKVTMMLLDKNTLALHVPKWEPTACVYWKWFD